MTRQKMNHEFVEFIPEKLEESFTSSKRHELEIPDAEMKEAIRVLMRTDRAQEGDVVFSYSIGRMYDDPIKEEAEFQREQAFHTYFQQNKFWRDLNPIVFSSAGNDYHQGRVYQLDDPFRHTSRHMRVGAVGSYDDADGNAVAWYSDLGADICAPMTHDLGEQYHGTSFAAPYMGSTYRVMSERYGQSDVLPNGLSYDELVSTAMMSADRNIVERDRRAGDTEADQAEFKVNGGGIPYHHRCGSGLVVPEAWDELAIELVEIKAGLGLTTEVSEQFVQIDVNSYEAIELDGENASEYVYSMEVPHDLTIGNLTMFFPQGKNAKGEIVIEMPSGDTDIVQQSPDGLSTSRRFTLEDVNAGETITIRSAQPLSEGAGIYMHGYDNNSAIAVLRDRMIEDGRLPKPLTEQYVANHHETLLENTSKTLVADVRP